MCGQLPFLRMELELSLALMTTRSVYGMQQQVSRCYHHCSTTTGSWKLHSQVTGVILFLAIWTSINIRGMRYWVPSFLKQRMRCRCIQVATSASMVDGLLIDSPIFTSQNFPPLLATTVTVPDRSVVQPHSFVQTSRLGGVQNGFASIFFSGLSIYHATLW